MDAPFSLKLLFHYLWSYLLMLNCFFGIFSYALIFSIQSSSHIIYSSYNLHKDKLLKTHLYQDSPWLNTNQFVIQTKYLHFPIIFSIFFHQKSLSYEFSMLNTGQITIEVYRLDPVLFINSFFLPSLTFWSSLCFLILL